MTFTEWVNAQAFPFGFGDEILACASHIHEGVKNSAPPVVMGPNILPTMKVAVAARQALGPLSIISAYRSPAYNAVIDGSAKNSQHMHFTALDLRPLATTPTALHHWLRAYRAGGAFKGGIGLYRSFVHVDTRGSNADWVG